MIFFIGWVGWGFLDNCQIREKLSKRLERLDICQKKLTLTFVKSFLSWHLSKQYWQDNCQWFLVLTFVNFFWQFLDNSRLTIWQIICPFVKLFVKFLSNSRTVIFLWTTFWNHNIYDVYDVYDEFIFRYLIFINIPDDWHWIFSFCKTPDVIHL